MLKGAGVVALVAAAGEWAALAALAGGEVPAAGSRWTVVSGLASRLPSLSESWVALLGFVLAFAVAVSVVLFAARRVLNPSRARGNSSRPGERTGHFAMAQTNPDSSSSSRTVQGFAGSSSDRESRVVPFPPSADESPEWEPAPAKPPVLQPAGKSAGRPAAMAHASQTRSAPLLRLPTHPSAPPKSPAPDCPSPRPPTIAFAPVAAGRSDPAERDLVEVGALYPPPGAVCPAPLIPPAPAALDEVGLRPVPRLKLTLSPVQKEVGMGAGAAAYSTACKK